MNDTRSQIITALFAFVPYVLISWGYVKLTHGDFKEFWPALGLLLLVRISFSVVEILGSVLSWHLYSKQIVVNRILEFLRLNKFPKRKYAGDDLSTYLYRIIEELPPSTHWEKLLWTESDGFEGNESEFPERVKAAAERMSQLLEASWDFGGILKGRRMNSAAEAALDIYSPRSETPALGA